MTPCVLDQKSLLCAEAELALANRSAGGHSMKDTQYLAYESIKIVNFRGRMNEDRIKSVALSPVVCMPT